MYEVYAQYFFVPDVKGHLNVTKKKKKKKKKKTQTLNIAVTQEMYT